MLFFLFTFITGNPYLSVILANIFGVMFNFKTYGNFVFKSHDNSRIYRFFGVYLFTISTQMILIKVLGVYGVVNPYIAGGILVLPMAALSFFLLRKFVFPTPQLPQE
jgi:putative flippase GtrA